MSTENNFVSRRQMIKILGLFAATASLPLTGRAASSMLQNKIPSSGEYIPVIGMGSSRTFDVGNDEKARVNLASVLKMFFERGGSVIDTSPMYGSSEQVLGDFAERSRSLSETEAVEEAGRCMSCGMCFECDNCVIYCPQDAVYRVPKDSKTMGRYVATDYTRCIGCHICADVCPTGYIDMALGGH